MFRQPIKIRPSVSSHGRHWGREVTIPPEAGFNRGDHVLMIYDGAGIVLLVRPGTHVDERLLEQAIGGKDVN